MEGCRQHLFAGSLASLADTERKAETPDGDKVKTTNTLCRDQVVHGCIISQADDICKATGDDCGRLLDAGMAHLGIVIASLPHGQTLDADLLIHLDRDTLDTLSLVHGRIIQEGER